MIHNILLSGVGGQGILLAGRIVAGTARAAGFDVATYEIHGMAQRGGSVVMHIKYGERVESSLIAPGSADLLGALEPIEALRNAAILAPDGVAVVAATPVIPVTVSTGQMKYPSDIAGRLERVFPRLRHFDFAALAVERFGNAKPANSILLGVLARELPNLPDDCWRGAFAELVKPDYLTVNMQAFDAGKKLI